MVMGKVAIATQDRPFLMGCPFSLSNRDDGSQAINKTFIEGFVNCIDKRQSDRPVKAIALSSKISFGFADGCNARFASTC